MKLIQYQNLTEKKLAEYFLKYENKSSYSSIIWESMKYTTLLKAKRLRAAMCLEVASVFNKDIENVFPIAASAEIMHAYSLIHDDLPGMDNDDLRRGKPTNHKVFGEAIAILAGDALISFGAQLLIDECSYNISKNTVLDIVRDYLVCAGANGLIAGQTADISAEGEKTNVEKLNYIHKYKTACLFEYSMTSSAKAIGLKDEIIGKLREYANNFGILFQIYDDIIDCTKTTLEIGKTAGKDKLNNKMTYVSAYGIDEAKNIFYKLIKKNHGILIELNIKSDLFNEIEDMLITRINN